MFSEQFSGFKLHSQTVANPQSISSTSTNTQNSVGKFSPTRFQNPCPICEDTKGKCRIISEDFVLCMTHVTDAGLRHWKYHGETHGAYLAGKYRLVRAESFAERQEKTAINLHRMLAQQKAQRQQLAKLPNDRQRDRLFQELLDGLTLKTSDRHDLIQRGLSEAEIRELGAKSVKDGYIIPIKNPSGLTLGAQKRLRNICLGRYRWYKSQQIATQLQNGELPLAFHGNIQEMSSARVVLVEGTGVKPYLAARLLNCLAIGASGGQFVASKQTLLAYLQAISANPQITILEYAIDAGDTVNHSVMHRHEKNLDFLSSLGYQIQVLWWEQLAKTDADIDELVDSTEIQRLTIEQFFELAKYHPKTKPKGLQWLQDCLLPKARDKSGGFVKRSPRVKTLAPVHEYPSEQRVDTWRDLLRTHRHILDTSATGTGKSYDAGLLRPQTLTGAERIIYISRDSRNVTTETLQDWQILPARHQGLTLRDNKLRRAKLGDPIHTKSNCSRTNAIASLKNKGIANAKIICESCPVLNACRGSEGDGFGFRHQRAIAFKSNILRSHPDSLPSPEDYDYSKTLLIWEEAGESLSTLRQINVDADDLTRAIDVISHADLDPAIQKQAIALLNNLHHLLADESRYGLDFHKIKAAIPDLVDSSLLIDILQPDLSLLDTVNGVAAEEFEQAQGKDKRKLVKLNALLRSETTLSASEVEQIINRQVLKQWLGEFLDILADKIVHGDLYIHHGKLTISLINPRLRDITQRSLANLYLDATVSLEDLELRLGTKVHQVHQAGSLSLPPINQITDVGRMTLQRGEEQVRKTKEIIKQLQQIEADTMVIDFKKFQSNADGVWFRDSRGSNDFANAKNLVIVGTPCPNIAALRAEYVTLTGIHPDENHSEFSAFVDQRILANVRQCLGRKTGHRCREGDQIYFLSNFDLGDIPHTKIKAMEITDAAMGKIDVLRSQVTDRINQAIAEGFDLIAASQRQLADWLGMKRGSFLHHAGWINSLLGVLYSKLIHNLEITSEESDCIDSRDLDTAQAWTETLTYLLNDPLAKLSDILAGIVEFFGQHIPTYLHRYVVDRLAPELKMQFFSTLALIRLTS